jgi:hypothetical protein
MITVIMIDMIIVFMDVLNWFLRKLFPLALLLLNPFLLALVEFCWPEGIVNGATDYSPRIHGYVSIVLVTLDAAPNQWCQ